MSIGNLVEGLEDAIASLRNAVDGTVITPGEASYDATRQVWNGLFNRKPRLIVVCEGAADVVASVRFAAAHQLPVAVRCGGHSLAGHGSCDGGVMLDLSRMRAVSVNPVRKTAIVQGGATAGDVIRETQAFGLAVPTGNAAAVGMGGLALGGGLGYLRRKYGLTCDNLLGADLVLADGRLVHVSATENSDLFWAIRGGGGNFGVAVSMEFQLHPIGPEVFAIHLVFDAADMARVARGCVEFLATATDDISVNMECITMPHAPMVPPQLHGRKVVMMTGIHAGTDFAVAAAEIEPLRQLARPILDLSGPMNYVTLHHMLDAMIQPGRPAFARSLYVGAWTDAVEAAVQAAVDSAGPSAMAMVWPLGGAMARVESGATAFGDRGASCVVTFDATADSVIDLVPYLDWVGAAHQSLQPHQYNGGTYLNLAGLEADVTAVVKQTYGDNYETLRRMKATYDPENRFRFNVNIR
ncbi:MAG: FAD-binding oxidoreductase [Alicyclobacillus sp.]|nr:FAD-binding oxidoreductase [Alicyclobacillus sp.]